MAILVSVVLMIIVLCWIDAPTFLAALGEANLMGLLLAWGIFGTSLLFSSWRWHLVLRFGGNVVHPGATVRGTIIGHCSHTFLFGAVGGDVVKSGIYARWYRLKMSEVLGAAPLDRLMALIGAITFGGSMVLVGALSGGFTDLRGSQLLLPVAWIFGVLCAVGLIVVVFSRWRGTRFRALDRFRATLQDGGKRLLRDRVILLKTGLAAFCVHACISFTMVVCLASVSSVDISWFAVLWLFPVISMISGLPIGVGGAGLREGSALVFLGLFGIPVEDAVAAALFTLAISFSWCFAGLFLWWRGEKILVPKADERLPETISVVIPTLNEADSLAETINSVRRIPEVTEILIADGGSDDETREIAESLDCRVFRTAKGRGTQMREATRHVCGDVVLMLHADTIVPKNGGRRLLNVFRDRRVVGGGFWKSFDRSSVWRWGSRFRCLLRLYLGGRAMGDQAMFARRKDLEAIGGVPDLPLMEEFELCRQLRRVGHLALADGTVITSARRFRRQGNLKTYWLMWLVTVRYYLGASVRELAEIYSRR